MPPTITPEFDPYARSFQVLGAAQDALAQAPPSRNRETWAMAVVLLRSPLANGIVKGAEFGYICATVAAAAITDSAVVRRLAQSRILLYGMVFYMLGLGGDILYEQLPRLWNLGQGLTIGLSVAQTSLVYVALSFLAARAVRPFKAQAPAPPHGHDRQNGHQSQHSRCQNHREHEPDKPQQPRDHD